MRIKGRLFRFTATELKLARELLGAKRGAKHAERRKIILLAEKRGLFCERTRQDCAACDGDCKKKPAISGCLESALANA